MVKIRPPVFAVGDDKKKGKEGYHSYVGSGPPWTDFYENWQGWRYPWCNHSVQFWFQYFRRFQIYRGSKFPSSHWLCWSSLQQCCHYHAACDTVYSTTHPAQSISMQFYVLNFLLVIGGYYRFLPFFSTVLQSNPAMLRTFWTPVCLCAFYCW